MWTEAEVKKFFNRPKTYKTPKFIRFFLKIVFAKWIFRKPAKAKVLIYDRVSKDCAKYLFNLNKCEFLDVRYESLNIYIIFKTLISFGFINFRDNYKKTYLISVKPKLVFGIDNNPSFYKLKDIYKDTSYISEQYGLSKVPNSFTQKEFYAKCKDYNNIPNKYSKADHIFLFQKNDQKMMSKVIQGKVYRYGSTKNNFFAIKKKFFKKISSIYFISSGLFDAALKRDIIIFNNLVNFCHKKNIKLTFCSRLDSSGEDFHRNCFAKGNWSYFPNNSLKESYSFLNKQQLVVFCHSTLGFEALAKGIKCASFYSNFPEKGNSLSYPKKGPFWTNSIKYRDLEKLLNKIIKFSPKQWNLIYKKYSSEILPYDEHNNKKKKIIKMILNN